MHVVVKQRKGEAEAFLVDILPRGVMPDPALIRKYYGKDAPELAYCALTVGRFVFRVTTGGYYVVSNAPQAKRFWRFHGHAYD